METYYTFEDAAKAMGINVKKPKIKTKQVKCRKCGSIMEQVPGTNVLVCHGEIEKDGVKTPCNNFTFRKES